MGLGSRMGWGRYKCFPDTMRIKRVLEEMKDFRRNCTVGRVCQEKKNKDF